MPMPRTPIRFMRLPTGCHVPVSHRLNQDGYFRWRSPTGAVMFHRFIWERNNRPIAPGEEIDHLCNNRSCCNPNHLQVLERRKHLVKTNKTRFAGRERAARSFWIREKCTGTRLSELYGVSFGTACRWIRKWRTK